MTDLKTTYLGLELENPIVPSASPLSRSVDSACRLEEAGAAALVMESLFEEQILQEQQELYAATTRGTESFAESLTYFPEHDAYVVSGEEYLEHIFKLKEKLTIPVIASLNGASIGGWTRYANLLEQAGADALELNIYFLAADPGETAESVETRYIEILKAVRKSVSIPVAIKLGPFFSAFAHMARELDAAGADGLVLFNRFYQPDLDLEEMEVVPNVLLSTPQAMRLPLRWIAILHGRLRASLAATGGVHTAQDVLKMLLVGADVTQMASALLVHGPDHVRQVLTDLRSWMDERGVESVRQIKGSMSYRNVRDPSQYERANYMKALKSYR
jgi:dihydroorotate dehydrogenase (fumarate)